MLCRDFIPRPYDSALEQTECGFDRVCCDAQFTFISHIFIGRMVHGLMLALVLRQVEIVDPRFIGHDYVNGLVHVAGDDVVQNILIDVLSLDEVKVTAALTNADYGSLAFQLAFVAMLLSTDVGFVNLDRASHLVLCFGHSRTDAMAEVPRGLVGDAKHPLDLIRRHSLARLTEEIRSSKPLRQRQVGIMEDRPRHYG